MNTSSIYSKDKAILAARPWKYEQNRHGYPDTSGWLRKTTRKGQWKKRWFRLQGSYLVYYKSSTSQKPLGFLDMGDITAVRRCFGPTKRKTIAELAAGASTTSLSSSQRRITAAATTTTALVDPHTGSLGEAGEHYLVLRTKTEVPIVLIVEPNVVDAWEPSVASWYKVLSITIAAVSSSADRKSHRNTSAQGRWTHSWHVESVSLCDELLRTWVAGSESVALDGLYLDGLYATVALLGTKLMRHPTRYSLTVHIEERTGGRGLGKRYMSGTAVFPTNGASDRGVLLVPCTASLPLAPPSTAATAVGTSNGAENGDGGPDAVESAAPGSATVVRAGTTPVAANNSPHRPTTDAALVDARGTANNNGDSSNDDDSDDPEAQTTDKNPTVEDTSAPGFVAEIYWQRIPTRQKNMAKLCCGIFCNAQDPKRWLHAHRPIFPALVRSMHPYAMEGLLVGLALLCVAPLLWVVGIHVFLPYPWTLLVLVVSMVGVGVFRSEHRATLLQCFDWYRQDQFEITGAAVLDRAYAQALQKGGVEGSGGEGGGFEEIKHWNRFIKC